MFIALGAREAWIAHPVGVVAARTCKRARGNDVDARLAFAIEGALFFGKVNGDRKGASVVARGWHGVPFVLLILEGCIRGDPLEWKADFAAAQS